MIRSPSNPFFVLNPQTTHLIFVQMAKDLGCEVITHRDFNDQSLRLQFILPQDADLVKFGMAFQAWCSVWIPELPSFIDRSFHGNKIIDSQVHTFIVSDPVSQSRFEATFEDGKTLKISVPRMSKLEAQVSSLGLPKPQKFKKLVQLG